MTNFDDAKFALEAATGGKNTLILDDLGVPSVMVKIPKLTYADVGIGSSTDVLPAFKINNDELDYVYVSKYQNVVENGRAYSLPMRDPKTYIDFDTAGQACEAKGDGWHLMTNAEWAAIALWCKANDYMPRGNNNFGADISKAYEKGIPTLKGSDGKTNRVATGSGPVSWAHDNTNAGIFDLNGNVWERCTGLRLNNGEIQIIADNNAAVKGTDVSATSSLWKAINSAGQLVAPGSTGTLKYKKGVISTDAGETGDFDFESITAASDVTIPDLLKALALAPDGTGYEGDHVWVNAEGERLLFRGGNWGNGVRLGVFAIDLHNPRSHSSASIGFRSCYYDPKLIKGGV